MILLVIQLLIPPFYPRPDLLLLLVVSAALLRGTRFAVGIAFIAGILQDIFIGSLLGYMTIVKILIGALASLFEGNLFKDRFLITPFIFFPASLLHEFLYILISEKLLFHLDLLQALKTIILPQALVNSLLGMFIYIVLYYLDKPGGSYYGD